MTRFALLALMGTIAMTTQAKMFDREEKPLEDIREKFTELVALVDEIPEEETTEAVQKVIDVANEIDDEFEDLDKKIAEKKAEFESKKASRKEHRIKRANFIKKMKERRGGN